MTSGAQPATLAECRCDSRRMTAIPTKMFDSDNPATLPPWDGECAYAGYVDESDDYSAIRAAYPGAVVLSITGHGADADIADIETRLMADADAPGWFERQIARGLARPMLYRQASSAQGLIDVMTAAGIGRARYCLWTAHYDERLGEHICGPDTCGYPQADGTQWTSAALGRSLDQSMLGPSFFAVTVAPTPQQQEADVYSGTLGMKAASVPVAPGTVGKVSVYADFTSAAEPLEVRVAVHSAAKGYRVVKLVLDDSKPHLVDLTEADVDAVSFLREDKDGGRTAGYVIY